jgi:hypothetical protein
LEEEGANRTILWEQIRKSLLCRCERLSPRGQLPAREFWSVFPFSHHRPEIKNADHDVADNAQVIIEFENGVNVSMGMTFSTVMDKMIVTGKSWDRKLKSQDVSRLK